MRALILTLAILIAAPALADQNDPRLDALFEQLRSAPSAEAAAPIDAEIWRIWLEHADRRTEEVTLIGTAFMNSGRARLAELAFKEALDRSPDFAEAWNKRATLRYLKGDYDGSVEDCAHVLKLEPRHFGALSGLGLINMAVEDYKAAIAWFEQALAVHPNLEGAKAGLEEAKRRRLGRKT